MKAAGIKFTYFTMALAVALILTPGLLSFDIIFADEVSLKNGDRISGKVIRMEHGKLVLKTDYAGEITIKLKQVLTLRSDTGLKVMMKNGTIMDSSELSIEKGSMKIGLDKSEESSAVPLADIKALYPKDRPSVRITARANAGFTRESGNSDTNNTRIDATFIARTEKNRYTLGGELNREKSDGEYTTRNWSAYANYDYFVAQKWFWYGRTSFEEDRLADLRLRTTLGTGLGHQFFESDHLNLSLAAGPGYVIENFIDEEDDQFAAAKSHINYDQYFFNKSMQLFHNQTGYISLENANNWRIETRQGVRFPLHKGFIATLQYSYDYDHDPSANAEANYDSNFMFLLGYEFKN
jgi:putative salt-induced outer membrane protein YdiY